MLRTETDRITGWEPPGQNTQKEAMAELGVLEAMAGIFVAMVHMYQEYQEPSGAVFWNREPYWAKLGS